MDNMVASTNKIDRQDKAEILLKAAINNPNLTVILKKPHSNSQKTQFNDIVTRASQIHLQLPTALCISHHTLYNETN